MARNVADDLEGRNFSVRIADTLALEVRDGDGRVTWSSSTDTPPSASLADGQVVPLHQAQAIEVTAFAEGNFRGHCICLAGLGSANARLELVIALDGDDDTLLVRVEEPDGGEVVTDVHHLYRFEKPTSAGGYMVLPHGSGYLIPAACPDDLPGARQMLNYIGKGWSMPLFGMVRGDDALCLIVEDWWDCWVDAEHRPGEVSAFDVKWASSLGTLRYPRGMLLHLAKGMDYVQMAGRYRQHAQARGLARTLAEKAEDTPAIRQYIESILVRWGAWNPETKDQALADLRRIREMGFGVNFFFPKWPPTGFSKDQSSATTARGLWQGYLLAEPVPGGWRAMVDFDNQIREMGCLVQGFVAPLNQVEGAPRYDAQRSVINTDGKRDGRALTTSDAVERNNAVLASLETNGLHLDVIYYDGYSAYGGPAEDFNPEHPCDRRQTYQAQNDCFADTRAAGIMPGAELARFWCIPNCDYFFYTDWSSDRLTNGQVRGDAGPIGEPVPLFELVFHDCYIAGFSGGGYATYNAGYDWWPDCTPRLYELMFCSAPAFNWLPHSDVPVQDWDSAEAQARWAWLKRWSMYHRTIAMSRMTAHKFLSADHKLQRIEFANGVTAEFDMAENLCRVQGVDGFSGDWETPAGHLGDYPCLSKDIPGAS